MYRLRNGSRKEICPNCGKRTFTPYIDETGTILDESTGYCDRRDKCGYHKTPGDFFKEHPELANRYRGVMPPRQYSRTRRRIDPYRPKSVKRKELSTVDFKNVLLSQRSYGRNPLVTYLRNTFAPHDMGTFLDTVLEDYFVGTSAKFGGSVIFWLIDHLNRVRDGKIMGYEASTGKRVKKPYPQFTNVHSVMASKSGMDDDGNWRPCLYGAHLAAEHKDTPIWLFESEKAALIVATFLEWGACRLGIPMATAGCSAFNPTAQSFSDPDDRLAVLKGRDVVIFPDEGKYDEWHAKGLKLRGFCQSVYVSTVMEADRHETFLDVERGEGEALDDLLLRSLSGGTPAAELLLKCYTFSNRL